MKIHSRGHPEKNRRLLMAAVLLGAAFWAASGVRADYNPQRIGFSHTYPATYADWGNAFLA